MSRNYTDFDYVQFTFQVTKTTNTSYYINIRELDIYQKSYTS